MKRRPQESCCTRRAPIHSPSSSITPNPHQNKWKECTLIHCLNTLTAATTALNGALPCVWKRSSADNTSKKPFGRRHIINKPPHHPLHRPLRHLLMIILAIVSRSSTSSLDVSSSSSESKQSLSFVLQSRSHHRRLHPLLLPAPAAATFTPSPR